MYYAEEKVYQMGRSILPSTARKNARVDKAAIKRRHRRHLRTELALMASDPDRHDDLGVVVDDYPDTAIRYVMYERREADKLNHFQHWAVRKTRALPQTDRLNYMRGLLPRNLIGDHAMSHLRNLSELENPDDPRWGWWNDDPPPWVEVRAEMERRLQAVCQRPNLLDSLNRQLEMAHVPCVIEVPVSRCECFWIPATRSFGYRSVVKVEKLREGPLKPRLLAGAADVESFLEDVVNANRHYYSFRGKPSAGRYHPEWLKTVEVFLKGLDESIVAYSRSLSAS